MLNSGKEMHTYYFSSALDTWVIKVQSNIPDLYNKQDRSAEKIRCTLNDNDTETSLYKIKPRLHLRPNFKNDLFVLHLLEFLSW